MTSQKHVLFCCCCCLFVLSLGTASAVQILSHLCIFSSMSRHRFCSSVLCLVPSSLSLPFLPPPSIFSNCWQQNDYKEEMSCVWVCVKESRLFYILWQRYIYLFMQFLVLILMFCSFFSKLCKVWLISCPSLALFLGKISTENIASLILCDLQYESQSDVLPSLTLY